MILQELVLTFQGVSKYRIPIRKYNWNLGHNIFHLWLVLYKRTSNALETHWINNEKNYDYYLKVRLFEIFTSVEGEGILYGTKTLFVRLAGCPFTCFYCDTKESLPLDSGKEYDIQEASKLIDSNLKKQTYKVNFTGGDPLIQHEAIAKLAKHVQDKKIPKD